MEAALHERSKRHSGFAWVERYVVSLAFAGLVACGSATANEAAKASGDVAASTTPAATAESGGEPSHEGRDVAQIHRAKCGVCHTRVEPGQRTRAELEAAFPRHRKRVRLSEDEWGRMIDYLAAK